MKDPLFNGCATAVITPMKHGKVDIEAYQNIIKSQLQAGVSALVVLGTTGEPASLTKVEKELLVTTSKEVIHDKIPLIIGVGSNDTAKAIDNAIKAYRAGADALLVVTPYYNKCTQEGLYRHYCCIQDAVQIPIIIYNVPSRTGVNIEPKTIIRVAENCNICGVKDATGNLAQATELQYLSGSTIPIYCGDDMLTLPFLSIGASGVISVVSNAFPALIQSMYRNFICGDILQAKIIQVSLQPLIKALFTEVNPIPVKYLMSKLGYCVNELRLPLTPASDNTMSLIDSALTKLRDSGHLSLA